MALAPNQRFFMSSKSEEQLSLVITLDEYKFKLTDVNESSGFVEYKGKMEVSYDGEFLGIDTWESPIGDDFSEAPIQQVTLVGADQANLLVGAILALLESYGESSLYNDKDTQKDCKQLVQATKDSYAEKAFE
jgi:hypothetical protein